MRSGHFALDAGPASLPLSTSKCPYIGRTAPLTPSTIATSDIVLIPLLLLQKDFDQLTYVRWYKIFFQVRLRACPFNKKVTHTSMATDVLTLRVRKSRLRRSVRTLRSRPGFSRVRRHYQIYCLLNVKRALSFISLMLLVHYIFMKGKNYERSISSRRLRGESNHLP